MLPATSPSAGMQAEQLSEQDAERVLHDQEREQRQQEAQQPRSAAPQQREVGGEPDRGKEQQQKRRPRLGVAREADTRGLLQDQRQHGEQQPADDRCRDAEARQNDTRSARNAPTASMTHAASSEGSAERAIVEDTYYGAGCPPLTSLPGSAPVASPSR
jgi:hypothetical protein